MASSGNNKMEKELEGLLYQFFKGIGLTIKYFFVGLFYGIKKMRNWKFIVLFFALCFVTVGGFHFKKEILELEAPIYITYLLYFTLLLTPFIFIVILGNSYKNKLGEYEKIFMEIEFKGRDKKYPYFCGKSEEGKKIRLIFKSNIPLDDWKSNKKLLETGFDCNIINISNGSNKKIVHVLTIPSDYAIPKIIQWSDEFLSPVNGTLTVGVGAIDAVTFDLNRVPHVLCAGETGSGKSVILRTMLWQMINQGSKVYMIDFKGGVEFGKVYEKYGEVIIERERALQVLTELVKENQKRLALFRNLEVKNLGEYNRKTGKNLCRIGVFCDEIAEMLDKKGVAKEEKAIFEQLEGKISTLARLSRATGINLILGVQRPDANVLTGQIKNNIPVRISGRFADKSASEIVLGNTDAVNLPDIKGRFLYKVGNETIEFQAYYFDDDTMLLPLPDSVQQGKMLSELEKEENKKRNSYERDQRNQEDSKEIKEEEKEAFIPPTKKEYEQGLPKQTLKEKFKEKEMKKEMESMDEQDLNFDFGSYSDKDLNLDFGENNEEEDNVEE